MKRILSLSVLLVLTVQSIFASATECNINYFFGGKKTSAKNSDMDSSVSYEWGFIPFGFEVQDTWYKNGGQGFFTPGFDFDFGVGISGDNPKWDGTKMDSEAFNFFTISEFLSLGPAFGFNLHPKHTLRFTPALQFNFDEAWNFNHDAFDKFNMIDFYLSFSLNFAYHLFFTDTFGLNLGFDLDIPMIGVLAESWEQRYDGKTYSDSTSYTLSGGCDYRFFVGITLRQGGSRNKRNAQYDNVAPSYSNGNAKLINAQDYSGQFKDNFVLRNKSSAQDVTVKVSGYNESSEQWNAFSPVTVSKGSREDLKGSGITMYRWFAIETLPEGKFDFSVFKANDDLNVDIVDKGNGASASSGAGRQTPPPIGGQYYVSVNNQSTGPYDMQTLTSMANGGMLKRDSLVWSQGMESWQPASSVPELSRLFR